MSGSSEPFAELTRPGSAIVIDEAPNADVGSIGSNNIMGWKARGAVGVVTDATARDTDEIITEQVPLYFRKAGRGIRPWRNEVESGNRPVVVGGVLVKPGDVIVADGDGVQVVPRDVALEVAVFAHKITAGDKEGAGNYIKNLGYLKTHPCVNPALVGCGGRRPVAPSHFERAHEPALRWSGPEVGGLRETPD